MLKLLLIFALFNFQAPKDTLKPNISRFGVGKAISVGNPVSLKGDLTVSYFHQLPVNSVRMVYDSVNHIIYSNTFEGDIYKTQLINGNPQNTTLYINKNEHLIDKMQGLLYYNNTLYLAGNQTNVTPNLGKGWLIRCNIGYNGNKTFSNVIETALYASSTTLFDHNLSAICLTKNKDSLLVASGSRTDHGEIKDVNGQFPNLREEPLTTKVFCVPINASNIFLQNDETWLQNSGYVFCNGVRNEFDIALNAKGEVFGVENSGDRDDPEELNLLKKGKHFGFPWRMGGNSTPQQFTPYNPNNDLLLPSNLGFPGIFYNDPSYPMAPSVVFEEPIQNMGPDANWVRNPVSGVFEQQSNIATFTSHRSPVGLNFDLDSLLDKPYNASAFVLAYSTGGGAAGYLNAVDEGADLCQIKFNLNSSTGIYTVNVERLVKSFDQLVDAIFIKNELLVLEQFGRVYKVIFPLLSKPTADFAVTIDDNCKKKFHFQNLSTGNLTTLNWDFGDGILSSQTNPSHEYLLSNTFTTELKARNPAGTTSKLVNITVPQSLVLSSPTVESKVSGISNLQSIQTIENNISQLLFAEKNIVLLPGFHAKNGSVFKSEIKNGCQ